MITRIFPPFFRHVSALGSASFKFSSSELTAILRAKKGSVAGFKSFFDLSLLAILKKSSTVSNGFLSLCTTARLAKNLDWDGVKTLEKRAVSWSALNPLRRSEAVTPCELGSILMSRAASGYPKEKPRFSPMSCKLETPKSKRTPSTSLKSSPEAMTPISLKLP